MPTRITLILALIGYGLYALNAVISKLAALSGMTWPLAFGDVTQFLLLLAASGLLVSSALMREIQSKNE